jgi:cell division protein FtsB
MALDYSSMLPEDFERHIHHYHYCDDDDPKLKAENKRLKNRILELEEEVKVLKRRLAYI